MLPTAVKLMEGLLLGAGLLLSAFDAAEVLADCVAPVEGTTELLPLQPTRKTRAANKRSLFMIGLLNALMQSWVE
jgi:hypothetical protein